ncbi:MAG: alpha/beta hydrolase [Planctomycetes bacterium]|nr:alpha/beta hydrolase [Planctomycetota bacterium]
MLLVLLLWLPGCFLRNYRPENATRIIRSADTPGVEPFTGLTELESDVLPGGSPHYWTLELRFHSEVHTVPANDWIRGTCYFPRNQASPAPAILVFPILRGGESLSTDLACSLAKRGMVAFVFEAKAEMFHGREFDLAFTDAVLRQAVLDARKVVSWLQGRPEVNPACIGCVGISLGGILACLVDALEPRITASAWLLAGGDLVALLAYSRERSMRRARREYLARAGLTPEEFVKRHQGQLLEPLEHMDRIDPSRVLMITASWDRVVPRRNWKRLWEAAGQPELRTVPLGHFSSILVFPLARTWVGHFFLRQFQRQRFASATDVLCPSR